mmetsp:Transcript_6733/g.11981  ORF Transcript_6733/g.11981 Transcript_6733/m.11981 type:complete len:146 (+) Transcript_6733:73-510(+)
MHISTMDVLEQRPASQLLELKKGSWHRSVSAASTSADSYSRLVSCSGSEVEAQAQEMETGLSQTSKRMLEGEDYSDEQTQLMREFRALPAATVLFVLLLAIIYCMKGFLVTVSSSYAVAALAVMLCLPSLCLNIYLLLAGKGSDL